MRNSKRRLYNSFGMLIDPKADKENYISGILGFMINGEQTVEIANRPGFVYVRLRDNQSEVIQAYNQEVSPVYGLPVLVSRDTIDPTRYMVVSRETSRYANWASYSPYLVRHGDQHSLNDSGGGGDPVWVYDRQFMPLAVTPSGSAGAPSVIVQPDIYYWQGTWKYAGGTGTSSLLPAKPSDNQARLMLLYLNQYANPVLVTGTLFDSSLTGTSDIFPYIPSLPTTSGVPLAAIRLVSGTNIIDWDNIYDLRPFVVGDSFIPTGSSASAPANVAYVTLNTSTDLTSERVLTAGNTITLADGGAGSTITVGVSTGTYSLANHTHLTQSDVVLYENSSYKLTGSYISFDYGLDVGVTGTMAYVGVQPGVFSLDSHTHPSAGTSIVVYEDSVFKVTGTAISFNNNLNVSITGTVAFVDAASGGGGTGSVSTYTSSYLSRPSGTHVVGDLFFPSNSFYIERASGTAGSSWETFGPLFKFDTPNLADFTWVNKGSGTATEVNGGIFITTVNDGGYVHALVQNATPPFTLTVGLIPCLPSNDSVGGYPHMGILFRNSASGTLHTFGIGINGGTSGIYWWNTKWNSATSQNAHYDSGGDIAFLRHTPVLWFRLRDDGSTNRYCEVSGDGINWSERYSVGRTNFLTPNQVGIFVSPNGTSSTYPVGGLILSWKLE